MEFKKNTITIEGKKVFYWEKNNGKKETMVLLHGFPGNHLGLIDLARCLDLNAEYRIIMPDLPACGESEDLNGNHNLKNYSKWLNNFLNGLSINNAIIISHSFGSRVALVFSVNYPEKVRRLVLITPVVEVQGFIAKLASLYYKIAEILPQSLQKIWLFNKFAQEVKYDIIFESSNNSVHEKLIRRENKELKNLNPKIIFELFNELYDSNLISLAGRVKIKSLIIAGNKDEIATLKSITKLADKLDNASFEIIKNNGHIVPLEKPLIVAKIIKSWLS